MLSKGPQTAIVMCKYYAFKRAPSSNRDVKFPASKEAANSNFNVEVLSFQSDPTTISNVQIKKSFKPTSISLPKKLWVKISSKKF